MKSLFFSYVYILIEVDILNVSFTKNEKFSTFYCTRHQNMAICTRGILVTRIITLFTQRLFRYTRLLLHNFNMFVDNDYDQCWNQTKIKITFFTTCHIHHIYYRPHISSSLVCCRKSTTIMTCILLGFFPAESWQIYLKFSMN